MAAAAVAVAGEEEKTGVTVLHTHTAAETAIRYTELRTCSLARSLSPISSLQVALGRRQ